MKQNIPVISSLFERQEIVKSVAGFYAPSNRELSESLTIIGIREGAGVEQHFQEIYRRQQHNRVKKPENALVAVTKEYIANYRSSDSITRQLGAVALEINQMLNPNITMADDISSLRSGHRAFIRYVDLKDAFSEENNERDQKLALERAYFSKDYLTSDYVHSRLTEIKVKDARKLVVESIKDQSNRTEFWEDTLKSLQANKIAGPIIRLSFRN